MAGIPGERHIFISYCRKNPDMNFVLRIVEDLQTAGHHTWIDIEGIEGGKPWTDQIQRAIVSCYACVAVLSPNAMDSPWVRNELLFALRNKPGRVYPIMYKEVELPVELVAVNYIDFQEEKVVYTTALERLLRDLPDPPPIGPHLPTEIEKALLSEFWQLRRGAVEVLIDIAHGDDAELVPLAQDRLAEVAEYDLDEQVYSTAQSFLDEQKVLRDAETERAREILPPPPDHGVEEATDTPDGLSKLEQGALRMLRRLCQDYQPDYEFEDSLFTSSTYGQGVTPVELDIMINHGWVQQEAPGRKIRITDSGREAAAY